MVFACTAKPDLISAHRAVLVGKVDRLARVDRRAIRTRYSSRRALSALRVDGHTLNMGATTLGWSLDLGS
jgi:hypothetical protein